MLYEQLAGSTIGQMILTAAAAMIPIGELRFALPYGVALGLPWHLAFLSSVAGNIVPIPLIILFTRPVFSWLKKRTRLGGLISRLEKRVFKKAESVYRYEMLGLFILVAVPLPGTGAWTGAMVAALLDIRLKVAFPVITAGVAAAGVIVGALTHGFSMLF